MEDEMNNVMRKAFAQKQQMGQKLSPVGAALRKPYWEDPLYHFISRQHRVSQTSSNFSEMARLSELMSKLAANGLSEAQRGELDLWRQATERQEKAERKKIQFVPKTRSLKEEEPGPRMDNITKDSLKRRIFYPHTSPEHMIKALEKLTPEERKRTAKKLTKYLRSKIPDYLAQKGL